MTEYRDIASSHLRDDPRARQPMAEMARVFSNFLYDVYFCIYRGLPGSKSLKEGLLTGLIVFKEEKARVMLKLHTEEIRASHREFIAQHLRRMEAAGKGPYVLIRDAKIFCQLPFTVRDRAAFRLANVELPSGRPSGQDARDGARP